MQADQRVCTRAVVSWPRQHVRSQANASIGKQTCPHIRSQANASMCKQTCPRPRQHVCKLAGAFLATSACPQGSKYIPSHANVSLVTSARPTCPPPRYFFFCLFRFANHLSPATPVSACRPMRLHASKHVPGHSMSISFCFFHSTNYLFSSLLTLPPPQYM